MTVSFGVLSTYPPTMCGLATFSYALVAALRESSDEVRVVDIVDRGDEHPRPEAAGRWVRGSNGGASATAATLNDCQVAIIQREYGIYGGPDGVDVLAVARALTVPTIVVLHTVLEAPSARQRQILEELSARSAVVVTMTEAARRRLISDYAVDPHRVRVIPHGAVDNIGPGFRIPLVRPRRVLTWGLLGEGKGIEWAIEAMALLRDLRPAIRYSVVGQTHPRVLEREGERYRDGLVARAARLELSASVHFDDHYQSETDLRRIVRGADVVLLPYDSRDQVTSGVLIEAIAAGKPVVSTDFPHARELLSRGAGLIVGRQDPVALAGALREVLDQPGRAAAMAAQARRLAPSLLWSSVAQQYHQGALDALAEYASRSSTSLAAV